MYVRFVRTLKIPHVGFPPAVTVDQPLVEATEVNVGFVSGMNSDDYNVGFVCIIRARSVTILCFVLCLLYVFVSGGSISDRLKHS